MLRKGFYRAQCYKLLITKDKVYLIQYFQDSDQITSGYPGVGSLILEFLINILFRKQIRNIARSLDKGRLEKSNSIPKLLERTNFFYEIDRSMVSLKIGNKSLRMNHQGYYRYGRKGKGPDDGLSIMMSHNNVDLYFDMEYFKEYNKLISTFFPD
jgi:hypothetical protein